MLNAVSKWMVKGKVLDDYLQACRDAVNNLCTFKQDKRLQAIFEHCSLTTAINYYNVIPSDIINLGFTNDFYGSPTMYRFGQKRFSPSTLQYIGVLSNLVKYFGSLNGMRICEIGGGYGGQARTIMDVFNVQYHIIDLPEVCELQRRYCGAKCYTEPTGLQYDLVISNYALSEIKDNKSYIDSVLRRSKHGYITCNTDFVKLDWEHMKINDIPGERETNYILIW